MKLQNFVYICYGVSLWLSWSHGQYLVGSPFHTNSSQVFVQLPIKMHCKCVFWVLLLFWAWEPHIPCFLHNPIDENSSVSSLETSVDKSSIVGISILSDTSKVWTRACAGFRFTSAFPYIHIFWSFVYILS